MITFLSPAVTGYLHMIRATMNSQKYCRILENHLCNSSRRRRMASCWVFKQDDYSKYISREASVETNRNLSKRLKINFGEMQPLRVLRNGGKCPLMTRNLISSNKRRLEAVLVNKGYATKYYLFYILLDEYFLQRF